MSSGVTESIRPVILPIRVRRLAGEKQKRDYYKERDQDWNGELADVADKARRWNTPLLSNRFDQQVRSVADIGECAKERRAQRDRGQFAAVFGNKVSHLRRLVDVEVVEPECCREKSEI